MGGQYAGPGRTKGCTEPMYSDKKEHLEYRKMLNKNR